MEDEKFEAYKELSRLYVDATTVCDPLDYAVRQRDLLYAVSKAVLFLLSDDGEPK